MSAAINVPGYAAILAKHPPRIIRTESENEYYSSLLEEMDQRFDQLSAAEKEFADLLTLLIEDFEAKHCALPKASPLKCFAC